MKRYFGFSLILLLSLLFIASIPCWGAIRLDIGISTQAGWFGQAAADAEMQVVANTVKGKVNDVQIFTSAQQADLATWVDKHTGNKQIDLLIICGQFPNTLYKPGNADAKGSIAKKFLNDGNMILNTGDYMFYVVDGAGTNGEGGLKGMMDLQTTMWDDDTAIKITADGKKYMPTLVDYAVDRPWHLSELIAPWKAEVIFGQNVAGTRAEPAVILNADTKGRLVTVYQTAGQDGDPRGKVISEFIINWVPTVATGKIAVDQNGKLGATWGQIKTGN